MRRKYNYLETYSESLCSFLHENSVKYVIHNATSFSPSKISFSVYEDMHCFSEICSMLGTSKIAIAEYSKKEIDTADFLMIIPQKYTIDVLNDNTALRYSCKYTNPYGLEKANHVEQIVPFVIKKVKSKNRTTPFYTTTTDMYLFADPLVLKLADEFALKGIMDFPVFLKDGSVSDDVVQIKACNTIGRKSISQKHFGAAVHCPLCGTEKIPRDSLFQLCLNLDKTELTDDFYMTEEIFGEEIPQALHLISHRFYQALKSHKLVSNMSFIPVCFE